MIIFVIKNLRKQKNITLNNLCERTGLSHSYLTKLENNHLTNCSTQTLEKIATTLDTNIKNLFYTKLDIDFLKEKLNETIDIYGIDSKEALEISQLIDLIINITNRDNL